MYASLTLCPRLYLGISAELLPRSLHKNKGFDCPFVLRNLFVVSIGQRQVVQDLTENALA